MVGLVVKIQYESNHARAATETSISTGHEDPDQGRSRRMRKWLTDLTLAKSAFVTTRRAVTLERPGWMVRVEKVIVLEMERQLIANCALESV